MSGISPWRTPLALWEQKTAPALPHDAPTTGPKRRGQRWEAVVAEMLVEHLQSKGHTVEIVASNRRYVDPALDFLAAEIDYEVRLDGEDEITNVELKTVHPFKAQEWGEAGTDEAPVWYVAHLEDATDHVARPSRAEGSSPEAAPRVHPQGNHPRFHHQVRNRP